MSVFLLLFFTLILCQQADVFDGVTWGQIWVHFHCICPVFDVHSWFLFLSHPNSITVCSFYYCLIKRVLTFVPEWENAAPLSSLQSQTEGWQQFDYPQFCPLLFSFYTFPAKCTVFCVLLQCSVVCVLPCVHMIDKTRDALINTCTAPRSLLFLCLRYHHYQHHHWGHCRLHPLPRPHTGCDSLVLQVSVSGARTFLHDNFG